MCVNAFEKVGAPGCPIDLTEFAETNPIAPEVLPVEFSEEKVILLFLVSDMMTTPMCHGRAEGIANLSLKK
jgi:hypothetical protein